LIAQRLACLNPRKEIEMQTRFRLALVVLLASGCDGGFGVKKNIEVMTPVKPDCAKSALLKVLPNSSINSEITGYPNSNQIHFSWSQDNRPYHASLNQKWGIEKSTLTLDAHGLIGPSSEEARIREETGAEQFKRIIDELKVRCKMVVTWDGEEKRGF
jgi:hypothetical protein